MVMKRLAAGLENEKKKKEAGMGVEQKRHTCPIFVKRASENAPGSVLLPLVKPERERKETEQKKERQRE